MMEAENGEATADNTTTAISSPAAAAAAAAAAVSAAVANHQLHQQQQQQQQREQQQHAAAAATGAAAAAGAVHHQVHHHQVHHARCTDCSGRNPIKKRSRSAPWTVPEMLTLIDAKRKEREWCQMYNRGVKLPAAERWRIVAAHMEAKDMGRTGSQCQDKWENMMKDYKAVRDWQCMVGGASKNYFKDMTNKERKDANLPPQMDEIVFYSLHAIQSEKEEKKEIDRMQKNGCYMKLMPPSPGMSPPEGICHPPPEALPLQQQQQVHHLHHPQHTQPSQTMVPLLLQQQHKEKEGTDEDVNSHDSNSSGKRKARRLDPAPTTFDNNPVVFDNFVHATGKDGSKEFIDCFMKVLEKSDRSPDNNETKKKTKDTALLTRALVALADAVKMVAQKL